jgi:uncharacterized membrane protein (DUF373 family)
MAGESGDRGGRDARGTEHGGERDQGARQHAGAATDEEVPAYARFGNMLLSVVEDIIYVAIAALLAVAAGVLLVDAAIGFRHINADGASSVALEVLDRLLLVFIVVELLFAVRVTLRQREIVAEPFLIVGIIASIKEIIVLSVKAADFIGQDTRFGHAVREVAILGVLVLVLAASAVLLRFKERAPQEGEERERRASAQEAEDERVVAGKSRKVADGLDRDDGS